MLDELAVSLFRTSDLYARVKSEAVDGVYIYGAGFVGAWTVGYLEELGIPVIGFVDSNPQKWGAVISGKKFFIWMSPMLGRQELF